MPSLLLQFMSLILIAVLLITTASAYAADPQAYNVTIDKTGNATLDQMLSDASTLISLKQSAPVGSFALVSRAQGDVGRFIDALRSLGYYKGKVRLLIAGKSLEDPGLYDVIDSAPVNPPLEVRVSIDTGPLFHVRKITIQGDVPEQVRAGLDLQENAPAIASDVLAARERLLNALRDDGYALAKVDEPIVDLAPDDNALDVTYKVAAGARAALGEIGISGLKRMHEPFARGRLGLVASARFNPTAIEKARLDLTSMGVFSSVRAHLGETLDGQGRLPVSFEVNERPRHATGFGTAYSTDLGASFSASWQHRNLLGNAEQLNLSGGLAQLGGNSTTGFGYNLAAAFIKPDFLMRDQALHLSVGAIKQSLIAYDQTAFLAEALLNRKLALHWSGGIGLALEQAQVTQESVTRDYTLLSLPATLKYDTTDKLLDPTAGSLASVTFTPIQSLAGVQDKIFIIMQLSAASYLDLGKQGRSILALRGTIGDAEGTGQFELPPDKRFYAGGSATVRGYKYQSIGPQFFDGNPQGGTAMVATGIEFRQRILSDYGAVIFADAGQVSGTLLSGTWRMGAGVGARYYTGFGPLRLDVAFPLNSQSNSGSFELYVGLGQAF